MTPSTGQTINFRKSVVKNGKTVSGDSTAVQIDHVVALNDAVGLRPVEELKGKTIA